MITLDDLRSYAVNALQPPLLRITSSIETIKPEQIDNAIETDPLLRTTKLLIMLIHSAKFYLIGETEVEEMWLTIREEPLLVDVLFDSTSRLMYQLDAHLLTIGIQTGTTRLSVEDYIKQTVYHSVTLSHHGYAGKDTDTFAERESSIKEMTELYISNRWLFLLYISALVDVTTDVLTSPDGYSRMATEG